MPAPNAYPVTYDATIGLAYVFENGLVAIPTGGGSPGGGDTQIQYNNASAFAGSSNLTWSNATTTLKISGTTPIFQVAADGEDGLLFTSANGLTNFGSVICFGSAGMGMSHSSLLDINVAATHLTEFSNQVVVSNSALAADPSAILVVTSTTQGFASPRMTTAQRDTISSPLEGLEIYNLDTHTKNFFNGTVWKAVATV